MYFSFLCLSKLPHILECLFRRKEDSAQSLNVELGCGEQEEVLKIMCKSQVTQVDTECRPLLIFSLFPAAFAINIIIPWLWLCLGKALKQAPHFKHMRIPKEINRAKKYLAAFLALPDPKS